MSDVVSQAGDSVLDQWLEGVSVAIGNLALTMATSWLLIPDADLTGTASTTEVAPLPDEFTILAGWFMWVGLVVGVLALIVAAARLALVPHSGSGAMGRVSWTLVGIGLIGIAGSAVGFVLQTPTLNMSETVGFVQRVTFPFTATMLVISVVIAGIKTAWTQRGADVASLAGQMLRVLVVSAGAVIIVQLVMDGFDGFTRWVLSAATQCDEADPGYGSCFAGKIELMIIGTAANPAAVSLGNSLGALIVLILFLIASLTMLMQVAIMIVRNLVLGLMVGLLPLASSFTITEMGQQWFKKSVGWILAALLYKPVCALIIAWGVRMFSTWSDDLAMMIIQTVTGIAALVLTVVAAPTLMKLCVPMVGAAAGSAGAGMAAVAAVISTGIAGVQLAASLAKSMPGGGSGGGGPDGASPKSAPSSAPAISGPPGAAPPGGGNGAAGPAGVSGAGTTGAAGAKGAGTAGATGATGAAGASAAGGGAAAGAAGGPIGMAIAAGADKVAEIASLGPKLGKIVTDSATGEGASEQ